MRTFIRTRVVFFVALLCFPLWTYASAAVPGQSWERVSTPEAAGWSSAKLKAADQFARGLDTDAYLVVDRGMLVHEYGSTSRASNVHSIRKSVLSLLFGIYVDRGAIALNRNMAELDINDHRRLSDVERQATVQQLLQARSGIYHPAAYETSAMDARRPERGSHAPGTHFYYNNWDFNALGTIFRKLTNKTVFEGLRDDLAAPLQFENFSYSFDTNFIHEAASNHPAYVMRFSEVVSANGVGGQYMVVDLARDIVIVHKVNTENNSRRAVSSRSFGDLLKLIMDAKS